MITDEKALEMAGAIINNLDGRKGFDFYNIEEDILNEIKQEIAEVITDDR